MLTKKTWALVANGVHARILRGLKADDAEAAIELNSKADSTHLRDIMSDKSGRSFASDSSGRRSAMEPGSDTVLHDMEDFAREIMDTLAKHLGNGDFEQLVLLADPKMLGVLRKELSGALRSAVILERPVNLVHMAERDLRKAILELLETAPGQ